jgi:hypothetical protein
MLQGFSTALFCHYIIIIIYFKVGFHWPVVSFVITLCHKEEILIAAFKNMRPNSVAEL